MTYVTTGNNNLKQVKTYTINIARSFPTLRKICNAAPESLQMAGQLQDMCSQTHFRPRHTHACWLQHTVHVFHHLSVESPSLHLSPLGW